MSAATKLLAVADGVKAFDNKRRTIEHLISAQVIDRDGEVLRSKGIRFDAYLASNPIVLLNHAARELPIGRALEIAVGPAEVSALTQFAGLDQLHEKAETTYRLYRDRFMRAWSVGFQPTKVSREPLLTGQVGRSILDWELLEYSAVGIPSNPAAVARMVKDFRAQGLISLPDGATDDDLGKALGTVPLTKFWQVTDAIIPALGADRADERKGTRMEKKELDNIKQVFKEIVGPLGERISDLGDHMADLEGRIKAVEAVPPARTGSVDPSELVLSDGRPFFRPGPSRAVSKFGDDGPRKAPGHIRSRGEQALSIAACLHSLQTGDRDLAPLAWDLSEKLARAGHAQSDPRSLLLPLGDAALFRVPGHEAAIEEVGTICKQAYQLDAVDAVELARLRKDYSAKAPMDPLDETLGGSLIALPTQGEPIALLRAQAVVLAAGAQPIAAPPQGSIVYPRSTGDPTLTWLPPNTPIPESTVPTGAVTLVLKKVGGLVKIPRELTRFSRGVAETVVREALFAKLARTIDLAALEGTGASAQPLGIINHDKSATNTPTPDKVTAYSGAGAGANGNTLRPEDAVKMIGYLEESNEADPPTGFIMRPLFWANLANLRADAITTGDQAGVWMFPVTRGALSGAAEKVLSGVNVLTTTALSKTRVKGSGSGLTYLLLGNFRRCLVANAGVVELALSSDAGFASDQIWVRIIGYSDVGLQHPESFCLYDQLLTP